MNEGESADIAHFNPKNWTSWQSPLSNRKKNELYQLTAIKYLPHSEN